MQRWAEQQGQRGWGWDSAFHLRFRVFFGDTECPLSNLYVRKDMNVCVYVHQCVRTPSQSGYYDLINMKVKVTQSSPTLQPHGLYSPWNSPGQNTGVGSLSSINYID